MPDLQRPREGEAVTSRLTWALAFVAGYVALAHLEHPGGQWAWLPWR